MTSSRLNILILEDNPLDVELAVLALGQAGVAFDYSTVDTRPAFIASLGEEIDVILADYTLPQYTALEALHDMQAQGWEIPFIIVTGTISEEVAVECIKQGASDYLIKDRLARLGSAIQHALEEKRLQREKQQAERDLQDSEKRYRTLVELSPDPIFLVKDGAISYITPAGVALVGGGSAADITGNPTLDFIHPDDRPVIENRTRLHEEGKPLEPELIRLIRLDGGEIIVEVHTALVEIDRQQVLLTVLHDMTEQVQRERELAAIAAISEGVRTAATAAEMIPVILQEAMLLAGAVGAGIALYKRESGENIYVDGLGMWSDRIEISSDLIAGVLSQVFDGSDIFYTNSVEDWHDLIPDDFKPYAEMVSAMALFSLVSQDQVIGVFAVGKDSDITKEDLRLLEAISNISGSALQRALLQEDLEANFIETVLALANTLEARHTQTADHSQKLAFWAQETLRFVGGSPTELQDIRLAALLHDIGKIGVPDEILQKNGPLTPDEWKTMKRHPEIGAEIVAPIQKLSTVAPIIHAHQEKYDGSGYPFGLKGETIPLSARVLAAVDAFGAMTEDRVYREARSPKQAVEELQACAGTQFDPQVVAAFVQVLKEQGEI